MIMKIPNSKRAKALIIVDVQPGFLNKRNNYIIKNIKKIIQKFPYDFYVESVFHTEKGSLWDLQTNWILPKDENFKTVSEILKVLPPKNTLHIEKQTKSAFKGFPNLHRELRKRKIKEVHIVGLDANDCVLATACEAFDLSYFTYVIEECTDSSAPAKIRDAGFKVLRHVSLTNHSCVEKVKVVRV